MVLDYLPTQLGHTYGVRVGNIPYMEHIPEAPHMVYFIFGVNVCKSSSTVWFANGSGTSSSLKPSEQPPVVARRAASGSNFRLCHLEFQTKKKKNDKRIRAGACLVKMLLSFHVFFLERLYHYDIFWLKMTFDDSVFSCCLISFIWIWVRPGKAVKNPSAAGRSSHWAESATGCQILRPYKLGPRNVFFGLMNPMIISAINHSSW